MAGPAVRPWQELVDPGWHQALTPVGPRLDTLLARVATTRAAGQQVLPAPDRVLRAFGPAPQDVRVLLVGQDPYPTPGHAVGLSFSVDPGVQPLPRSLANVFRELVADQGCPPPASGDLTPWADRGVLLLNRVLTVRAGSPGSHRHLGWQEVTAQAVRWLAARDGPLVAVLWGRDAQTLRPLLADVPAVVSAHPSPLSAARGFTGSRPFSRANDQLRAQGTDPVDWTLP